MRKNGEEWPFDAAKALAECESPHIAYVALYSDVEHEVSMVTSAYRSHTTSTLTMIPRESLHRHYLVMQLHSRTNWKRFFSMRHFFQMVDVLVLTCNIVVQWKPQLAHTLTCERSK